MGRACDSGSPGGEFKPHVGYRAHLKERRKEGKKERKEKKRKERKEKKENKCIFKV